ncbi:MAG: response regulator [Roseovarius sp.]
MNTLILDDEAIDRSRLRRMAKHSKLPLKIFEAPSLSAMSDAMEEEAFDLFFLDYKLPEGDGLDAVNLIRNQPANCDAALIMITGLEARDLAVSAFRQGCDDLITKAELSPDLLKDRIHAALSPTERASGGNLFEEEKYHRQMRDALRTDAIRDEITNGLRRAVRQAHLSNQASEQEQIRAFVKDFLEQDEFRFK